MGEVQSQLSLARDFITLSGLVITGSPIFVSFQALAQCSTAATASKWAYTYTGTILTPAGALPAASIGHFTQDRAGNVSGSQSSSVAGKRGWRTSVELSP